MSWLLACMTNRADLLGEALHEEREVLNAALPHGAGGCGAGFYQAGEVLHRKRPRPIDGQVEWSGVLDGVRSNIALAYVRDAQRERRSADDTQPFRMRQWLYTHVGDVAGFSAMRERLLDSLPDFLRRNLRGNTPSELLFHVMLSFLHDAGQLDGVDVADNAVVSALRSSIALLDRFSREVSAEPASIALALTNGRQLYALSRGQPLLMIERERVPQQKALHASTPIGTMKYVIVTSGTQELSPEYRPLADSEVLCIDRDLHTHGEPL